MMNGDMDIFCWNPHSTTMFYFVVRNLEIHPSSHSPSPRLHGTTKLLISRRSFFRQFCASRPLATKERKSSTAPRERGVGRRHCSGVKGATPESAWKWMGNNWHLTFHVWKVWVGLSKPWVSELTDSIANMNPSAFLRRDTLCLQKACWCLLGAIRDPTIWPKHAKAASCIKVQHLEQHQNIAYPTAWKTLNESKWYLNWYGAFLEVLRARPPNSHPARWQGTFFVRFHRLLLQRWGRCLRRLRRVCRLLLLMLPRPWCLQSGRLAAVLQETNNIK